ncbi:MAG: glycosyltransferase family 4 protein [Candidatus Falkowbacteria bacterium]
MKIYIINNLYKPYARGGAERVVEIIVKSLEKAGNEVLVVSTRPWQTSHNSRDCHAPLRSTRNDNYYPWNLISYYNLNKLPKFIRPLWHLINIFNLQSYFKIKKILKRENFNIVMTHNLMGVGFLTPRAIKKLGIRHIHTLHDIQLLHPSGLMNVGEEQKVDSIFAKIYQWINRKLFASPDVIISPSQWLLDEHLKRGFFKDSKKVVLRNPVQSLRDCHAPLRFARNDSKFIFLYVGQIEKHKGIDLLIEAFQDLKSEKCILKIVGDGKEQGNALFVQNNIKFLGKKSSEEVQELMQKANCLVVPSLCYENQPTVIFEAQQNNLPVIASNIGGIPEILDHEFLFKAGDRESLNKKMQWIMDNYKNIPLAKNKINNYNIEEYIEKILNIKS